MINLVDPKKSSVKNNFYYFFFSTHCGYILLNAVLMVCLFNFNLIVFILIIKKYSFILI